MRFVLLAIVLAGGALRAEEPSFLCAELLEFRDGRSLTRVGPELVSAIRAQLPRVLAGEVAITELLRDAHITEGQQRWVEDRILEFWEQYAHRPPEYRPVEELAERLGVNRADAELLQFAYGLGHLRRTRGGTMAEVPLSPAFGHGNVLFSRLRAEEENRQWLARDLLLRAWIPRFSVGELADPHNARTAQFRERWGTEVTEQELYAVVARRNIYVSNRWREPLHREQRRSMAKQALETFPELSRPESEHDAFYTSVFGADASLHSVTVYLHGRGASLEQLAQVLGVSEASVQNHLHAENLSSKNSPVWSDAQVAILRAEWGNRPVQEIAWLTHRSYAGVRAKAHELGLTEATPARVPGLSVMMPDGRPITVRDADGALIPERMERYLRAWVGYAVTDHELARRVGITPAGLRYWRDRLSVQRYTGETLWPEPPAGRPTPAVGYAHPPPGQPLEQWRAEMRRVVLERAVDEFLATGRIPSAEEFEAVTGYRHQQVLGVGSFATGPSGVSRDRRFYDGPSQFWIAFSEEVLRRDPAPNGAYPHDFSPFHPQILFFVNRSGRDYVTYLSEARTAEIERERLLRRFLSTFQPTTFSGPDVSDAVGLSRHLLFSNSADNQPGGVAGHLGRFRSVADFVVRAERMLSAEEARLAALSTRTAEEDARLTAYRGFTPWLVERVPVAETTPGYAEYIAMFGKYRPRLQRWVLELAAQEEARLGRRPSVQQLAAAIVASTHPLRSSFPRGRGAIANTLTNTLGAEYRYIFPSNAALWQAYEAR